MTASTDKGPGAGIYLNGATIMTTPTDRHVRIARETGYDGVEVRAERLLADPAEVATASGLVRPSEVWSLNGIQLQLTPQGELDHDRLALEMTPRLDVCRRLAAANLLVVPPRAVGADSERAIEAMRDGLAILRDAAARDGIGVAFEFLGFADCPIDTPELAGRVVADLPGVDLVLDSCHWHASGGGSLEAFPIDRVAMVHLNDGPAKSPRDIEDADRLLPGRGVIRLAELIAMLRAGGYGGPWSLETFNPEYWAGPPEEIATEGRAAIAQLLAAPADTE